MKLHPWLTAPLALLCLAAPARAITITHLQGDGETWLEFRVWTAEPTKPDYAWLPGFDQPIGVVTYFDGIFVHLIHRKGISSPDILYFYPSNPPGHGGFAPAIDEFGHLRGIYRTGTHTDHYRILWGDRPAGVPDVGSTFPMLGIGLLGLIGLRWRRHR